MTIPFFVYFISWIVISFAVAVPLITFYMMFLDARDYFRKKKGAK